MRVNPHLCKLGIALIWLWCACIGLMPRSSFAAASSEKIRLPAVALSKTGGYYEQPFSVTLSNPAPGSTLRFTVDGSEPTPTSGTAYLTPLHVTNTTLLRAAAFKDGVRVSSVGTCSYIFIEQALHQPSAPDGFPHGPHAWDGAPSAYQMDARVVDDPIYRSRMKEALRSLPLVLLVCSRDDLFGPRGIYVNSMEKGADWERPCSVEMILPGGELAFQVDCGVQIQGNMNRVPEKSPKHAFRLLFKAKYGAGKLHYQVFPDSPVKKFDTLLLRADFNNSWIHWDPEQRARAQRIRDAWLKDSARAMGWKAPHNRFAHLFLNGLYWGIYDFTERPDAGFAAAYFGGDKEDYDVINESEAKDGTLAEFEKLKMLNDVSRPDQYKELQLRLDLTNYVDYLLLNYYAGNQDWGEEKNWYAILRRKPPGRFQYIVWDGEQILNNAEDNTVDEPEETPFALAVSLRKNADFQRLFAERVQKHCLNGGALTAGACSKRWSKRASEVDSAMIAESARWGWFRRKEPFTRDNDYIGEQQRLISFYFPQRTFIVLAQLKKAGLYPGTN